MAMTGIADARFGTALLAAAARGGKVRGGTVPPDAASHNTPERLRAALAPFRRDGTLPVYPLGSDFTVVEQRLVKALGWLKASTGRSRWQAAHGAASAGEGKRNRYRGDGPHGIDLPAWGGGMARGEAACAGIAGNRDPWFSRG